MLNAIYTAYSQIFTKLETGGAKEDTKKIIGGDGFFFEKTDHDNGNIDLDTGNIPVRVGLCVCVGGPVSPYPCIGVFVSLYFDIALSLCPCIRVSVYPCNPVSLHSWIYLCMHVSVYRCISAFLYRYIPGVLHP